MIDLTSTLKKNGISTTSVASAIQTVRELVGDNKCSGASKVIGDILNVDLEFTDPNVALVTTLAMIETIVKSGCTIDDEETLMIAAVSRAQKHLTDPQHLWMYAETSANNDTGGSRESAGIVVATTAEGNVKRGGKQLIANALYKQMFIDSPNKPSNKEFLEALMKEANMTLAGARTYFSNSKKAFANG